MIKKEKETDDDITRKRLIWLIIVLSLVTVFILVAFLINKPGAIEGVVIFDQQARGHNDSAVFEGRGRPPVGGTHHSEWLPCGIYEQAVDPAKAVHTLEHGAVWITYHPDLASEQIAHLEQFASEKDFMLLSPFPEQQSPIILSAWGVQLDVQDSSDERIPAFISRYRLGPTTPERGASC